jgi:hypothetical protein
MWFNYICRENKTDGNKAQVPVQGKMVMDNKIIEQVNSCNYLVNLISYEKEVDIDNE